MADGSLRVKFLCAWALLSVVKFVLAARLPVMTDEAFYAWEARHLAWAYSDLPGMTAWMIRLGMEVAGHEPWAIRLPFLLMGSLLPWLVLRISQRWFGVEAGLRAGLLCLLMPLSGLLGVLALPDVPLVLASLVCLDAIAQLRERVSRAGLAWLSTGLVLGAFTHYRFGMMLLAGACGLLLDARARRLLFEPRFLLALAVGTLAWWPLLQWNLDHAGAGLRFQLLDRNPWAWDSAGLDWLCIQALLVTPLLFLSLLAFVPAWLRRAHAEPEAPWRLLLGVGGVAVWAWFIAGFFVDRERVSFHWPLAGWLVWIIAFSAWLPCAGRGVKAAIAATTGAGLLAAIAWLGLATSPGWRSASAGDPWYPDSFAGSSEVLDGLRGMDLSRDGVLVADNFALAAQLALAMPGREVYALDHPLNRKHGRAAQLELWQRRLASRDVLGGKPVLLAVEDSAFVPADRLQAYRQLCRVMRELPRAKLLAVDHGRRRYLFHRYDAGVAAATCVLPAMAWIDLPAKDALVSGPRMIVTGWAFKEGAGVEQVEILVDGRPLAKAEYGLAMPHVQEYWRDAGDPAMPRVGFKGWVDLQALPDGAHWLGLRVHGRDGSVEDMPEQRFHVRR